MSLGFRDPNSVSASDNIETPKRNVTTKVIVDLLGDAIPNKFERENAYVSNEVRPGLLVIKVTDGGERVANTIYLPFERIGMVQQIESE